MSMPSRSKSPILNWKQSQGTLKTQNHSLQQMKDKNNSRMRVQCMQRSNVFSLLLLLFIVFMNITVCFRFGYLFALMFIHRQKQTMSSPHTADFWRVSIWIIYYFFENEIDQSNRMDPITQLLMAIQFPSTDYLLLSFFNLFLSVCLQKLFSHRKKRLNSNQSPFQRNENTFQTLPLETD